MTPIGNDIVALDAIDAVRTREPVFYSRIITHSEKMLYSGNHAPDLSFEQFVWLCWSVKESVYKCVARDPGHPRFSPLKIVVLDLGPSDDQGFSGFAVFGDARFYYQSSVDERFIATWAIPASACPEKATLDEIQWRIDRLTDTDPARQSAGVRELLLEKLRQLGPEEVWGIEKAPAGYPVVVRNSRPLPLPLSFSHHHDLVFYTIRIPGYTGCDTVREKARSLF